MVAKSPWLGAALRYARRGLYVVPFHSAIGGLCTCGNTNCTRPGKHPRTPHGVKDATRDPAVIRRWWSEWFDANIGIAVGVKSGIIVIDVDPRNGGVNSFKAAESAHGSLRDTTTSRTGGGGRHFIFQHPGFAVRKNALGPGIDILSDGQCVIVPPSVHSSGRIYSWRPGYDLEAKPPKRLPQPYRELLRLPIKVDRISEPNESVGSANVVTAGRRNATLVRIGGRLRRSDLSEAAIRAALQIENQSFQPPLEEAEVERIVKTLFRYPDSPDATADDPSLELCERVLVADFAGGDHLIYLSGTFWRFNSRYWAPTSDEAIQQCVLNAIQAGGIPKGYRPNALSKEVVSLLKPRVLRDDDPLRFQASPLPVINCRNGEVWLDNHGSPTLKPHVPASGLRSCLEVDYDPSATCPHYDRVLAEIFSNTGDPAGMMRFWHELTGYVIQPDRSYPMIIVLWGSGRNGKSKLVETLTRLLGLSLVYAGKVERLSANRFGFGDLFGKHLFIDDDVAMGIKLPDGELKTISEAKLLTGEEKYKPAFNFVCRTLPILLCNHVPSLTDLSVGMRRRLMVVPFKRVFPENRTLFPEIWAREMSGVLNQALSGYRRLLQHNGILKPGPVVQATTRWLRDANPINAFLAECYVRDPSGRVLQSVLYAAFVDWCKRAGISTPQQLKTFKANLLSHGLRIEPHTNRGPAVLGLTSRRTVV